ncbi:MAG: HK97 family phage prohead protease [Candidatus Binataceae bacterium]
MIQRLSHAFEFKAADIAASGEFVGWASTFDQTPDSFGDVVARGAFTESLRTHAAKGTMPALLWGHDAREPIGRWLELKETERGLFGKGKLTLGTARGREAHALMKDDALGLSIGYNLPADGRTCDRSGCLLKQIDLKEISVVSVPANSNARIVGVKSACSCNKSAVEAANLRELEQLIHAGVKVQLSSRKAKAAATALWGIMTASEPEPELAERFNSITTKLRGL